MHATSQGTSSNPATAYLLGFVGVFIFGSSLPATALALVDFSPWFTTFARAAIAALCALVWAFASGRSLRHQHNNSLFLVGLLLIFGFPGFMALGLVTVPASHGAIVLGLLPILTAIISTLLTGERPTIKFWILGAAGAIAVVAYAYLHRHTGEPAGFATGDFWLLLANLCAATGYVLSGKLSKGLPGYEVISRALILNIPLIAAGTIWFWEPNILQAQFSALFGLAYVGLFSMFLGFFAWNTALAMGGIAHIGQIQLLQIFITIIISAALLGEAVDAVTLATACLITLIIALSRKA